ncbi:DUF4145 domain-containing protein [Haladaptatus cibarius]|uniref:DUF4145 domain-containing protein n=1 Tax=Haladaptatus cibarius TaxID=453847 RepID=UPI000679682E|nr:DUF4145 domain-containing protein [Haladaptatus cibarius]
MIERIRKIFRSERKESHKNKTEDSEDILREFEVFDFPPEITVDNLVVSRQFVEQFLELDQLLAEGTDHLSLYDQILDWNDLPDNPSQTELREAWYETKEKMRMIERADERSYRHSKKYEEILGALREMMGEEEIFSSTLIEEIESIENANRITSRYFTFCSWKATANRTGFELSAIDGHERSFELQHRMKIQFSNLLLTTTAVIETGAFEILKWKYSPVAKNTSLRDMADSLFSHGEISKEEKELIWEIVDIRNNVAHDVWKRTELDWSEDLSSVSKKCSRAMNVIEYPYAEQLKAELGEETATEWYSQ